MADCLVYFFTGFLDSGKTSMICSWLGSENIRDKKIVVLTTEEGEEEYIPDNYPGVDPVIINVETEEVNKALMFDIEKKYKPDILFMEWNGSDSPGLFFEEVDVPRRWMLAAAICLIDASTYTEYYRNMQTLFADYFRYCDTVIFNRVDPEKNNLPKLRGSVKALNPGANTNFFGENNAFIDIADHLPYDLNSKPCVIEPDDFGLFYTDALDNVEKYQDKTVTLVGRAVIFRELRGKAFSLQRQAYTCCADDIGQIDLLCIHEYGSGFPVGQWLKVTGTILYHEEKQRDGSKVAVPALKVDEYAITSKPENEIIYFS